nr:uncharacterized protein LOC107449907 [Parasteatoda tepidariorum]
MIKLLKKYEKSEEDDKKRQESKLQILLALETEILAPHSERLELIKNITSYFYRMSFFMSASEQIQFFQDVLRENYEDTLHDIVVELSEELDIPLSEMDEDSTYETSEPPSSESMLGSNNSRMSVLSVKSSSGSSSRAENRKVVCRNDIMNNIKSRQFLLTRSSPRKKKYKNLCPGAENIPIRYSPRLSSKRRKERNLNCSMNAINVRRNLFPKDQKLSTPKYSRSPYKRKRMRTPKSHHVLKTKFVPETPTSKQNLSALQRRKSFMDTDDSETSLTEIAESPKINKSAKNTAQCELLKQLNELETNKFVQPEPQPVPSCSFHCQYTPESKRRLSLKLFSKYLTSPTARTGLRKCSKRLFDQVSPHVEKETSKRLKVDAELDDMSLQEFPGQEETPKKS